MFKPMLALTLALTLAGCAATMQQERPVDRSTERHDRPEWVMQPPTTEGRLFQVTAADYSLSIEEGVRRSKAYALAAWAEQTSVNVSASSQLVRGRMDDRIAFNAAAVFRSIRQDKIYWEKLRTEEGTRYDVWVLWSIPERAFYEAQQEASR